MLRSMRTGALKGLLFAILLLATVGLALMDYQGMFRQGFKPTTVAEIAGEKITSVEFDQLLQSAMRRQRMKPEDAYRSGYPAQYLQNEINSRVLRNAVRDFGLIVSEEAAAKQIRGILNSFPTPGVSEKEALQTLLYNLQVSERALVENQKIDIGLNLMMRSLTAGIKAPEQMATDAMKYKAESRRAEYFTITAEDAGKSEKPSDADLAKYYDGIKTKFMLPEHRTIEALVVDAKTLVPQKDPTEDELKAHYEARKDGFAVKETSSISQLVVPDAADAKAFYEEAKKAGDLKKVADAHKDKATFIKASPYGEADIPMEIAAAFKADEGTILEPAESPLGWIIARVEKHIPPHNRPYDEVKDDVRQDLLTERANDNAEAIIKRVNEIDDMIAGGQKLSDVAASLNLKTVMLEKVTAAGLDANNRKVDTKLPVFDKLLAAAFRLEQGRISERIETPNGEYVLVTPHEVFPAVEQPLEKVRADVQKAWDAEKHGAAIDQLSAKIMDRLKLGEDFESVAKSFGKKVTRTDMILRSDHAKAASMAQGMFPALFSLEKIGQVTIVGGASGSTATILRLADRTIDATRVPKAEDIKTVRDTLDHAVQKDMLEQFRMSLMAKYDVKIHEDVLTDMYKNKVDGSGDDATGSN